MFFIHVITVTHWIIVIDPYGNIRVSIQIKKFISPAVLSFIFPSLWQNQLETTKQ